MSFSVSTFNLCNLQCPNQTMFGEFAWTPSQYQRKVGWTAEQLKAQPATLMAFQEVWREQALQDVLNTAGLQEQYQLVCHESGEDMNVACAVHRDWGIIGTEWIVDFPAGLDWRSDDTRYEIGVNIKAQSASQRICWEVDPLNSDGKCHN